MDFHSYLCPVWSPLSFSSAIVTCPLSHGDGLLICLHMFTVISSPVHSPWGQPQLSLHTRAYYVSPLLQIFQWLLVALSKILNKALNDPAPSSHISAQLFSLDPLLWHTDFLLWFLLRCFCFRTCGMLILPKFSFPFRHQMTLIDFRSHFKCCLLRELLNSTLDKNPQLHAVTTACLCFSFFVYACTIIWFLPVFPSILWCSWYLSPLLFSHYGTRSA